MARNQSLEADDVFALVGRAGGEARGTSFSGTKALMLAILEDGIRTFLGAEERAFEEAENWIFGRHQRTVFSFDVVCETLGLEPKAVRVALRRMSSNSAAATFLPRSRPNSRGSSPTSIRLRTNSRKDDPLSSA